MASLTNYLERLQMECKVGQTWERRDGKTTRLTIQYPNGNTLGSDNHVRRSDGKHYAHSEFDLIKLISGNELPVVEIAPGRDLDQFKKFHAELSDETVTPPYPAIIVSGTQFAVIGINGYHIGAWSISVLNELKAATGYQVYELREIEFKSLRIKRYEVQP